MQRSSWERIGRGKLLLRFGVLGGASAPTEGGEGRGHIVAAVRLQLVDIKISLLLTMLFMVLLCTAA